MVCEMLAGTRARMPARMMSETPLPIPNSVTSSPSHISSIEPAATSAMFATSATVRKECGERIFINARDGNSGKETEERERTDKEENTETNARIAKSEFKFTDERIKHGFVCRPLW